MATARRLIDEAENHYTLVFYQGIAFSKIFEYTDSTGTPINLTGKIISIKFKGVFPTQLELFSNGGTSTLGSSFLITDAVNGKLTLQISLEETLTATLGNSGKWWIELEDGTGLIWIDNVLVKEI